MKYLFVSHQITGVENWNWTWAVDSLLMFGDIGSECLTIWPQIDPRLITAIASLPTKNTENTLALFSEHPTVHCHCAFKCLSTLRGGGCPAERSQVEANRPVCHPPPTARSPITIIMTPPVREHIAQLETTDTPDPRAQDYPSLTTYTHLSESRTEQPVLKRKR